MKNRLKPTYIVFGLMGGLLLLNLVAPIANLLLQGSWADWIKALGQPEAREAIKVSILASGVTVFIMTLLGVPLGYVLARARLPFKGLWVSLVFLPMVVPDLAGGILLLQLFGPYGALGHTFDMHGIELTNNLAGVILAQLFVASPFVAASAFSAFAGVDSKLEMAAAMLGDSQWQIFRRISLPLAWPGIAVGISLAWVRALGEFGTTLIMAYNPHTLPVYMWMKFESDGLAATLPPAFCLVLLALAAVTVCTFLTRLTGFADPVRLLGETGDNPA